MPQPHDGMKSHLEIATASIRVFADDGTIDHQELDHLLSLALRDGEVDPDEKRVLANIFSQVPEHELLPGVRQRMQEARARHGI